MYVYVYTPYSVQGVCICCTFCHLEIKTETEAQTQTQTHKQTNEHIWYRKKLSNQNIAEEMSEMSEVPEIMPKSEIK